MNIWLKTDIHKVSLLDKKLGGCGIFMKNQHGYIELVKWSEHVFNFVFIYVSDAANLCFVTFVAKDFEEKTFILSRETAKESERTVKIKALRVLVGTAALKRSNKEVVSLISFL